MNYRYLGSSGMVVSELGFGTWGIGGSSENIPAYGYTDDYESRRTLEKALDEGINFFDTAPPYGRAEELLGRTFYGSTRQRVIIATKVGMAEFYKPQDFSESAIIQSLEKSLKRLRTDYIDLVQLFNPNLSEIPIQTVLETLIKLKNKGLIRAIGASLKHPDDGLIALNYPEIVSLQINLNMLDHRAIDNDLLNKASRQNVGIIARTPLCFGFLTGKITDLNFKPDDHRSKWPLQQRELWLKASNLLKDILPEHFDSLTHLALKFCMDWQGVSTVIAGPITSAEVVDNVAATLLPKLSPEVFKRIREIYEENNGFVAPK